MLLNMDRNQESHMNSVDSSFPPAFGPDLFETAQRQHIIDLAQESMVGGATSRSNHGLEIFDPVIPSGFESEDSIGANRVASEELDQNVARTNDDLALDRPDEETSDNLDD